MPLKTKTDFLTIYSHEEDKEESKNVTSISTDKYYNNTLVNSKNTAIRLFNLRYKQVDINTVNSNFLWSTDGTVKDMQIHFKYINKGLLLNA